MIGVTCATIFATATTATRGVTGATFETTNAISETIAVICAQTAGIFIRIVETGAPTDATSIVTTDTEGK